MGVVVIPLLYETDAAGAFDTVVCVACSESAQQERLQKRGWDIVQIRQRVEAQWPVTRKMAMADFVIWTEAALDLHAAQLDRILKSLE